MGKEKDERRADTALKGGVHGNGLEVNVVRGELHNGESADGTWTNGRCGGHDLWPMRFFSFFFVDDCRYHFEHERRT